MALGPRSCHGAAVIRLLLCEALCGAALLRMILITVFLLPLRGAYRIGLAGRPGRERARIRGPEPGGRAGRPPIPRCQCLRLGFASELAPLTLPRIRGGRIHGAAHFATPCRGNDWGGPSSHGANSQLLRTTITDQDHPFCLLGRVHLRSVGRFSAARSIHVITT